MKKFWIIWNPEGVTPPTVTFSAFGPARREAERLAAKCGGHFHVLVLEGTAIKTDVYWAGAEGSEEVPF